MYSKEDQPKNCKKEEEHSKHKRRRRSSSTKMNIKFKEAISMSSLSLLLLTFIATSIPQASSQTVVLDTSSTNNGTTSANHAQASLVATGSTFNQQQQPIHAAFSTPNQAINITHVTYDPLHDTVYLGATNAIYQLNGTDLSEQYEQSTGPVFDNPSCGITECHGYEDYMKPTTNVNKILVIDYSHKKLISCGSTKQGACRRYQLNNISQKEDLIPMAVAANDDNSSTYAFIAPARYIYDPSISQASSSSTINSSQHQQQQQVLYVASTYTKVGQSRDLLVPAIGTRTLDSGPNLLKLYENSFLDSARIDINSHLRDYFLVNYLYGFASSNYIYFVTVQKKATSRDYEELGYHTRLARICITDSSYNSYTEVDLKCMPNKKKSQAAKHPSFFGSQSNQPQTPSEYPILQDAILVDAGSQLLQSLAQNDQSSPQSADFFFNNLSSGSASSDDNKVLLGVFSSARDHTQHPGEHSALCAFSLSQIEDKFNDNIHNCYTGRMQSRNMEYIAGNVQECPKSGQGGNVVNFCHETLKINGTLPIVSEASVQYYNTTLTAITATSHVNSNQKNIYSEQLANEASSLNSSKPTSIPSSSLLQGNQNQHTVAFMGTSTGHLKKVLLNNASNGIEFEDIQLDTNPILGDLHLHSSGQQLIVATPYKVMKVPTHNCNQYATCRECSQSKNPYCGWCSLKRSCTTKSDCVSTGAGPQNELLGSQLTGSGVGIRNGNQVSDSSISSNNINKLFKWISNESSGKCIDLQSIVPDKIPLTSMGKVDLYIDRLPRLPKEHSYKCVFDKKDQTTATPVSFGLSCPLPKVMHRPKIQPGRDHAIVDLAVRSSETNTDFLNGKITFFDCQLHTTCKDCLTTNWGCNWCLNENICLFNTSKCEKGNTIRMQENGANQMPTLAPIITISNGASQRSSLSLTTVSSSLGSSFASSLVQGRQASNRNTINLVNQCPTFDVGHKQDILIADGSEKELTIKVKNMPQFKGNINCIVEIENDKVSLKARIEEDRVICENSTYSYAADVGLLNGQLVVLYSDNNIFIDRTNFTMYKCHLLGAYLNRPDCSLCRRVDPRFNCVWCSGACHHKSRCLDRYDDSCPPPRIDYIHPLSGPSVGGTKLSIEGSNLGQTFDEIANRITVGNVPCKPIEEEYRPSNKIVCLTGPIVSRFSLGNKQQRFDHPFDPNDVILGDVMVGNKAGYSIGSSKFQFKSIYLRDHQPRYGPQSGGTRITLTGMNLNIGSSIQVFLDELPCLIEPSLLTSEQIVCRTSASRHASRAIKQLKLIIDDALILRNEDVYYYTQDPVINKIHPLRSYWSGGRPINVYGTNLTAVQLPRMAILDNAGKIINESTCIFQDDTKMQCPSPAVNLLELGIAPDSTTHFDSFSSTWTPIGGAGQYKFPQQDETLSKFKLTFIMDNVWRLRDLQTSYPALNTEITYTSDPKLYPLASEQYKSSQESSFNLAAGVNAEQMNLAYQQSYQVDSDTYLLQPGEPFLVLYGENLRAAVSEYEITITVGQDICNLTQLTQTKLICLMPLDHMATPTDEEGHQTQRSLPLIVVRIGFNLRFELGYVQYHPLLVEQIVQLSVNSSEQLPYMRPTYPQYLPRENETFLHKVSNLITSALLMLLYLSVAFILIAFVYAGAIYTYRFKKQSSYFEQEYKKIDQIEKSVKNECRLASLALQSDLNELIRHVNLTGIPIQNMKNYIANVFFPGVNNHPVIVNNGRANETALTMNRIQQQHQNNTSSTLQHSMKTSSEFPLDSFERLILTKPFLINFINTLESQPTFTSKDRANVASLVMIVLMERLDYATDIMRTLLVQHIQKSVASDQQSIYSDELISKTGNRLSKRTSNLIDGLAINKRISRTNQLGKVVSGSANNLMASTTVAAHMLLSRVGNKTSPLQSSHNYMPEDQNNYSQINNISQCMSTTTFNYGTTGLISTHGCNDSQQTTSTMRVINGGKKSKSSGRVSSANLILRQNDSVVEKMLTDWLALNMYDYLHGEVGHSLYMLFEALRSQLDRGPIDSISGDAYYSLNEHKLLREPLIHFEVVNLYIIVDTDILRPNNSSSNLLLDSSSTFTHNTQGQTSFYDDAISNTTRTGNYTTSNTITLTIRALDCDTISQVKGKILHALYRNSPSSNRLGVNNVELALRQSTTSGQFVTTVLLDEDYNSVTTFNGFKRVNTLRHYGIADQAIMMLNRLRNSNNSSKNLQLINRTALTDMLDEHYNNPYAEIQYGHTNNQQHRALPSQETKSWHLVKSSEERYHSNDSSPSSTSPSMMLLSANDAPNHQPNSNNAAMRFNGPQQSYYHPSSSSTSSTGNVMDTNSTSANSSSMNVTNLLARHRNEQPIYCQIGSTTAHSHNGGAGSSYYCQIGANNNSNNLVDYSQTSSDTNQSSKIDHEQERQIYLARMLTSKGTVQSHLDEFFQTILNVKPTGNQQIHDENNINTVICGDPNLTTRRGATSLSNCYPPTIKWLFDILDEVALENGITDNDITSAWKSNVFLLKFWANIIKNPDNVLDVDKSTTLDATLSIVAQTLVNSCSTDDNQTSAKNSSCNKMLFAKDLPRYKNLIKRFYQDMTAMRPVSDQEIAKHMGTLSVANAGRFNTSLAIKELCAYAVNYGVNLMNSLNNDFTCQQLDLSQQLEQCFRSFTIFEAYR